MTRHTFSGDDPAVDDLLVRRRRLLGRNLNLSYKRPLHIVRGSMQYLWDAQGQRYLDAYNNVPHVGHCHPHVVEAAHAQMALLNTNTRYLHEHLLAYADRLGATLPGALKVCYFVNSGSEANELALRLAFAHTGRSHLIVLDSAYHGNTTTMTDISPYKYSGVGGRGAPTWVHAAPLPDLYRGPYRTGDPAAGVKYARHVASIIDKLQGDGGPAGFIAESWPSAGGQLELPQGYLSAVYHTVRAAGGLCIADEVQTAYGRLGNHFWGFQAYGVIPDIVTAGKPIGNGHPIGVVITTPEIAESFANGMEFFSTYGGNTVSAAIGTAVLDVVQQQGLQAHALSVGKHLGQRLSELMARHPLIGDVRGSGLFWGVELVRDRASLEPAPAEAAMVVNYLRDNAVLIGTEGPDNNVLKIRPPMPFTVEDSDVLLQGLTAALAGLPD